MNEDRSFRLGFGIFLVLTGLAVLVFSLNLVPFSVTSYWPLFIMLPGLFLLMITIFTPGRGAIFPATILILVGTLFLAVANGWGGLGWESMWRLWPAFPTIVGIAFLTLFVVTPGAWGVLIPAFINLAVGLVAFGIYGNVLGPETWKWWPVLLVIIGLSSVIRAFTHAPGFKEDNEQR